MDILDELRSFFPVRFRQRGQRYFEQGRVRAAGRSAAGGALEFEVAGSGGSLWRVRSEPWPRVPVLDMECDCPAADRFGVCKHMWAVLLSRRADRAAAKAGKARGPGAAPGWRSLLGSGRTRPAPDRAGRRPAAELVHVLDPWKGELDLWTWTVRGAVRPGDEPPPVGEILGGERLDEAGALDRLADLARLDRLWVSGTGPAGALRPAQRLRVEEAPAWRLRVRVDGPGPDGALTLRGELWRPPRDARARDGAVAPESLDLVAPDHILRQGLLLHDGILAPVRAREHWPWIARLRQPEPVRIAAGELDDFRQQLALAGEDQPVELPEALRLQTEVLTPTPAVRIEEEDEPRARWPYELRLLLEYPGRTVEPFEGGRALGIRDGRLQLRDPGAEAAAADFLLEQGFRPADDRVIGARLHQKEFLPALELFLDRGWRVYLAGEPVQRATAPRLQVQEDGEEGWFEIGGGVELEGEDLPISRLVEAILAREKFARAADGRLVLIDDALIEALHSLGRLAERNGERLRMPRSQGALLDALLAQQERAPSSPGLEQLRRGREQLCEATVAPQPPGMAGELRGYQREGLAWLLRLDELGLGGCLADDMGLGKTIQVIALFQALRDGKRREDSGRRPHLVVAPRSVVHNWARELQRFVPHLRVHEHTGPRRHDRLDELSRADVILTTYATLRRDAPRLEAVELDYLVLDEAQAVKNPRSVSAKAVRLLRARHRLALSGTPVENDLGELWALMDFLQPGLLGPLARFRRWLREHPAPSGEHGAARVLGRVTGPYMLRRTKDEVLAELPPRTEQLVGVELAPAQRRFYGELRRELQASIGRKLEEQPWQHARMHVLEALLRLRQAACHPGLLTGDWKRGSAKLDALLPMVAEIAREGHKALVFSQFTRLLALVREQLDAAGIGYSYLDGGTRERTRCIDEFRNDPARSVFLISLKAGGVGLNLSCANYVFLLDPWWNPAVEAQAIDRAHRIGQEQPVFSYRLVARDTVEERILELQRRKRRMAEEVLGAGRGGLGGLDEEDVAFLLG